ncbi:MAG: hypothetical protein NT004_07940 [Bacteroidetes bacterium]|nr:hypothetical protein [Bacteroidota bacterium]
MQRPDASGFQPFLELLKEEKSEFPNDDEITQIMLATMMGWDFERLVFL